MRSILRLTALVLLLTALAAQSGCGGGSSSSSTSNADFTITISPTTASVIVGGLRQFTAEAHDKNGFVISGLSFSWHSSNTQIATSVGGGNFKGVAVGVATITASASRISQAGGGVETVSSNPASLTVNAAVAGTAATGAPLADASVSLRDARGQYAAASADDLGHFEIPVAGMTAPFLLKAQTPDGRVFYGMAMGLGTANVDPYTDFLVRAWYTARGGNPETAFVSTQALPDPRGMQRLDQTLVGALGPALAAAGLDPQRFSLLASPFDADHSGFDRVLDQSRVDAAAGRIEVAGSAITLRMDGSSGSLSIQDTRADGSTRVTHWVLP